MQISKWPDMNETSLHKNPVDVKHAARRKTLHHQFTGTIRPLIDIDAGECRRDEKCSAMIEWIWPSSKIKTRFSAISERIDRERNHQPTRIRKNYWNNCTAHWAGHSWCRYRTVRAQATLLFHKVSFIDTHTSTCHMKEKSRQKTHRLVILWWTPHRW